jgi:hypothetical protein
MKRSIVRFLVVSLLVITIPNIANAFVPSATKADTSYKTMVSLRKATSRKPISVYFEIKNTGKTPLQLANFVFTFKNFTDKNHFWGIAPSFRYIKSPLQLNKSKKIVMTIPITDFRFINIDGELILQEQVCDLLEKQMDNWYVSVSVSSYEKYKVNPYASLDSDFPRSYNLEEE